VVYLAKTWLRTRLRPYIRNSERLYRVYAAIRVPTEEYGVSSSRRRYASTAARLGISVPTGAALQHALRQRLAQRGIVPTAKPKGALHIFTTYPNAMWEANFPRLLKPFGDVSVFDWRARGFDDTSHLWLRQRDEMNRQMLEHFAAVHAERPVDVVFAYVSGHTVGPETLAAMGARGAIVVNVCMDDKGGFPGPKEGGRYKSPAAIAAAVDLNLTTSTESLVKYAVHGGLPMFFPLAADPELCQPPTMPFAYDVTFVGGKHAFRPFFIDRLRQLGIVVETFGSGWPRGPISDEDRIRVYAQSRINLGFSATGNSRNVLYLKGRDFEIPMSGGLYLTSENPELARCFDVGREIVTYRDEDDCAQKIRWLLSHEAEAGAIRRAGVERARREHTWEHRLADVFTVVGFLQS